MKKPDQATFLLSDAVFAGMFLDDPQNMQICTNIAHDLSTFASFLVLFFLLLTNY